MLNAIFLWIYCMDFYEVLLLLALSSGLFYTACAKLSRYRFWKPATLAVLLIWAAAVITLTIFSRTSNPSLQPIWQPFQSYFDALQEGGQRELLRSNFMNAVLFYPAGLLSASILPEKWRSIAKAAVVLAVFAALSAAIEFAQFRYCLGIAQTDDVIHNVLGAVIGALVMCIPSRYRQQ